MTKAATRLTERSTRAVTALLDDYGAQARRGIRRFLHEAGGEPIYALAADYPERGGRTLRATLCMAAARAYEATVEQALNSAVALELMHNAFLVHDDVEDGSEERRGRPTMHELHGVPVAINVGDALAVISLRPLMENRRVLGPRLTLRVLEETERMARVSVEGQALELGWRQDARAKVTVQDYLRMILKKTCWYTVIHPCRVGALIGSRDGEDLDRFVRFGFLVGAAFQIQDDILNLIGDPRRYGKEIDGDIYEGKWTLMLIHVLGEATADERREMKRILRLPRVRRRPAHTRLIRRHMDRYGSIEFARQTAHGLAGAALHDFRTTFGALPPSRDRDFLEALPLWALDRR